MKKSIAVVGVVLLSYGYGLVTNPKAEKPPTNISFTCVTCTNDEALKLEEAEKIANEVVQSDCFKKFMLNWGLLWTNGKTPEQVVEHIQTSNLEVPVHYYRGRCSTVGYRNPGKPDIYLNRCSHDSYDAAMTASNATHEWSHVLGYDHPFTRKSWRGRTVPYAINNAFEACWKSGAGDRN